MIDCAIPFQLETNEVRGRLVRLGPLLHDILHRHQYPAIVNEHLSEAVVLGITLANCFKFDGIFTLQISGDGPIRMLVVDITSQGDVRACARFDQKSIEALNPKAKTSVPKLFGNGGYLAFTIDQEDAKDRYQGIVELSGKTLSECIQHFFRQSEQLETGIIAFSQAPQDGNAILAAALMVQRLPGESTDSFEEIEQRNDRWLEALSILGTAKADEFLSSTLSEKDILYRLYWERGVRLFDPAPYIAKCRCSRDKILDMLETFSPDDIKAMIVDNMITVTCEFCSQSYAFEETAVESKSNEHAKE